MINSEVPKVASMPLPRYVLITPARNEQSFIEIVIRSVSAQTLRPHKWLIVSDGSTDRTDEIVRDYSLRYPFLQLVRTESHHNRNFSAKVAAFKAGYELLQGVEYQFVGNLDADISVEPEYFQLLLNRFRMRPELGIAGGLIWERISGDFEPQDIHRHSVAGAVQMFRRRCFEGIGGYIPIRSGGVDAAAEIIARMHGWGVETFPDLKVLHHRRVATGTNNVFATRFRQGLNHAILGYHPLFQAVSSLYRLNQKPYLLGAMLVQVGYWWASLTHRDKILPHEAVEFLRKEQLERLSSLQQEFRNRVDNKLCNSPDSRWG